MHTRVPRSQSAWVDVYQVSTKLYRVITSKFVGHRSLDSCIEYTFRTHSVHIRVQQGRDTASRYLPVGLYKLYCHSAQVPGYRYLCQIV